MKVAEIRKVERVDKTDDVYATIEITVRFITPLQVPYDKETRWGVGTRLTLEEAEQ